MDERLSFPYATPPPGLSPTVALAGVLAGFLQDVERRGDGPLALAAPVVELQAGTKRARLRLVPSDSTSHSRPRPGWPSSRPLRQASKPRADRAREARASYLRGRARRAGPVCRTCPRVRSRCGAPMHPLAKDLNDAATAVDSTKQSNTKWAPVELLLAEALSEPEDEVYAATLSKAGNVAVRFNQSPKARAAGVVLGMFTGGSADLSRTVDTAAGRFHVESRRLVLVFDQSLGPWSLRAVLKPAGTQVPPILVAAWSSAVVLDVS